MIHSIFKHSFDEEPKDRNPTFLRQLFAPESSHTMSEDWEAMLGMFVTTSPLISAPLLAFLFAFSLSFFFLPSSFVAQPFLEILEEDTTSKKPTTTTASASSSSSSSSSSSDPW
jgi:hypothetical protein